MSHSDASSTARDLGDALPSSAEAPFRGPRALPDPSGLPPVAPRLFTALGDAGRQALLEQAVLHASEVVLISDPEGVVQWANPALERISGYRPEEVVGRHVRLLSSGRHDLAFYQRLWARLLAGLTWKGTFLNKRKDGSLYREEATISPVLDAEGTVRHYVAIKRDLSEEERLHDQALQAARVEAVGRLAGGVADEFNNLLATVIGFGGLARQQVPAGSAAREDLDQVLAAGQRAVALTRQLQLFSRKQPSRPRPVDLAEVVTGAESLLRRLLPAGITLELVLPAEPAWSFTDPEHVEQVLLNLVANAQDAMPDGGALVVRVESRWLDGPRHWSHGRVSGGAWATLTVTDGGHGMGPEVLARLFEPFFTTRGAGRRPGLGLATVSRIAEEASGQVEVSSAPGFGASVTLWLPLMDAGAARRELARSVALGPARLPRGAGRVWLVEDDARARQAGARDLRERGFDVSAFTGAEEVLRGAGDVPLGPDLLVVRYLLPGGGGAELALELRRRWPGLEVLFLLDPGAEAPEGGGPEACPCLGVPFTGEVLAARVLELLGQAEG